MSNETALVTELLKFSPDTLLEFFVLDLTPIVTYYKSKGVTISPTKYYFFNGLNQRKDGGSTNITWQGNTYAKVPISMDFIDTTSGGELPRPTIKIADNSNPRILLPLLLSYADLIGCNIIRKRTFLKFIDAVNFNGGVSPYTPDSTACFPDETFRIERKSSETALQVEFELAVAWDMEGVLLPRRLVLANLCPWEYRKGSATSMLISSTNTVDPNTSDSWTTGSPSGSGAFSSVAHNGTGTVVAVGKSGTIFRSTDYGVTWSEVTRFTSNNFNAVEYCTALVATVSTSRFVGVCTRGYIFYSADGLNWTASAGGGSVGLGVTFYGVTSGNNTIVAVGNNKNIYRSTDFSTWTLVPNTTFNNDMFDLNDVKYSTTLSKFIACGTNGVIISSTISADNSWTKATVPTTTYEPVFKYTYVTIGGVITYGDLSVNDQITLSGTNTGAIISGFTSPKTYYVIKVDKVNKTFSLSATSGGPSITVTGTGGTGLSFTKLSNPTNWVLQSVQVIPSNTTITNVNLSSIAINAARVVIVGAAGVIVYTDNLTNWNTVIVNSTSLNKVIYTTSNIFLALNSYGTIFKSITTATPFSGSNGVTWDDSKTYKYITSNSLIYIPTGSRVIVVGSEPLDGITSGCTYDGAKCYDQNDIITASEENDVCGKRLSSCLVRFGSQASSIPFGGFPSSGLNN